MEGLIKQIKYKRLFLIVDSLIDRCEIIRIDPSAEFYVFTDEKTNEGYKMFTIRGISLYLYYRNFIEVGMSEDISEIELESYIYERFITRNKVQ